MTMQAGTEIAGRFRVVAQVGAGGMGEVYRARDLRLERDVAIKVPPAGLTADPDRLQRFEREARAAAALNHPNILALYDVGEHEGAPYLVSELLEGESLRERLAGGALPVKEVVRIGVQVARGLAAAHAKGIVHRDLKPDNLFLTADGTVKILDFGLASLRREAAEDEVASEAATATAVTAAGVVLGTAGYMAPEQVRGRKVDQRADIFALGCVLYELLTGRRAFAGGTTADTLGAILRDEPEPIGSFAVGVSPAIAELVSRCLEKSPEERLSSAHDLGLALQAVASDVGSASVSPSLVVSPERRRRAWPVIGAAVVLLAAVASLLWLRERGPVEVPAPELDETRVLVAPVENLTGDPGLDAVGLMAADAFSEGLQEVGGIQVVRAGTTAEASAGAGGAGRWLAVAREQGAGLLVTGALYLAGSTLELHTRIIETSSGELLYALDPDAGPREAPRKIVAAARDRVMGAIAYRRSPIRGLLGEPIGYRAFREFEAGMVASGFDWSSAAAHFQRAVELAPDCWMARIRLAVVLRFVGETERAEQLWAEIVAHQAELAPVELLFVKFDEARRSGNSAEVLAHARRLHELTSGDQVMGVFAGMAALNLNRPREALELMGDLYDFDWSRWGQVPQGEWVLRTYSNAHHLLGEYEAELEAADLAARLYPGSLGGRQHQVRALAALGRLEELEDVVEATLSRPMGETSPGTVLYQASEELRIHGHPAEALAMAEQGVAWYETHPIRHEDLGSSGLFWNLNAQARLMWVAGDDEAARRAAEAWAAAFPDSVHPPGYLGALAAYRGDFAAAARVAARLEAIDAPPDTLRNTFFWRAVIAAHMGDIERAFELLREAFANGYPYTIELHQKVYLEPLDGYPPFEKLIAPEG
jgi:tetratricopeptide (TPR) repeat protein